MNVSNLLEKRSFEEATYDEAKNPIKGFLSEKYYSYLDRFDQINRYLEIFKESNFLLILNLSSKKPTNKNE